MTRPLSFSLPQPATRMTDVDAAPTDVTGRKKSQGYRSVGSRTGNVAITLSPFRRISLRQRLDVAGDFAISPYGLV